MRKLLILLCIFTVNAAPEWKLVKEKNGIEIYSQQKSGYKLKHHQANTTIKKDISTILAVLQDTDACKKWVYRCISNKMVEMIDIKKRIYHTIIHTPLWFKNRDMFLESSVIYDPEKKELNILFISQPQYNKKSKNRVRITDIEMSWRLKYLTNEMTSVTYQLYIDPKLPIKTINNRMIKKSIFQTLLKLKEVVEDPIYEEIKYSTTDFEMLTDDK